MHASIATQTNFGGFRRRLRAPWIVDRRNLRKLRTFFGGLCFFLSPRRRSGERTKRGIITQCSSSPRPSAPADGGAGVCWVPAAPGSVNVLEKNFIAPDRLPSRPDNRCARQPTPAKHRAPGGPV